VIRTALAVSAAVLSFVAFAVAFQAPPALAADTASINGSTTFQSIAGFGFAEAFGEAASVMNAPSTEQQQALSLLMSTSSGAGLDIIRNEISADSGTTIEPNSPGSPSAAPTYVSLASINQDQGQLWFDQQAKSGYGVTNIFADAWSAPAFMKTNGSVANGGQVCGVTGATCSSGDWRQAYANYLLQYAKDYSAAGVPLTYIGPSNEPDFSATYDSMTMSASQMANLLDVVGPTMKNSGLSTQVECCAATGWPNAGSYASAIEADPTALADTAVAAGHGYSGGPTSPLPGWTKPAWETEWFGNTSSTWDPAWDDGTVDSGLTWAQHIYQGLTGANLSAFLFWQGADPNNGNGGLVYLQSNGTAAASGRLWAFANYSRYIRPGAVRIGSTSSNSGVDISAYKNTDGTVAVVALNTLSSSDSINYATSGIGGTSGTVTPYLTNSSSTVAQQSAISLSGGAFSATIPARSLVTYVIKPGGTAGNTVTVTSPGNQTGTVGTPVSVQVNASDSASGQTLTYSATGLPAGLSISPSTGLISGTPTAAAAGTVTVTAADATGAAGSATFTWTIGTGTSGGGTCHVTYTTSSQWAGGFTASVVIGNTGTSSIGNWTLTFTFPGDQKITSAWNDGSYSQSGENVSITNASYNGTIAAGGNTSVGFQGTWASSDAAPTSFAVNGVTCT